MMHDGLLSDREWALVKEHLELFPRQAEVVRHIIDGKSDRQIASELGISLATVRTHIQRLFQRFDVSDRLELVLHVLKAVRWVGEHITVPPESIRFSSPAGQEYAVPTVDTQA